MSGAQRCTKKTLFKILVISHICHIFTSSFLGQNGHFGHCNTKTVVSCQSTHPNWELIVSNCFILLVSALSCMRWVNLRLQGWNLKSPCQFATFPACCFCGLVPASARPLKWVMMLRWPCRWIPHWPMSVLAPCTVARLLSTTTDNRSPTKTTGKVMLQWCKNFLKY